MRWVGSMRRTTQDSYKNNSKIMSVMINMSHEPSIKRQTCDKEIGQLISIVIS
jgi:hypothetical protein